MRPNIASMYRPCGTTGRMDEDEPKRSSRRPRHRKWEPGMKPFKGSIARVAIAKGTPRERRFVRYVPQELPKSRRLFGIFLPREWD